MANPDGRVNALEARLGFLFSEQRRLREQLDQTRAELDRVNAEVQRVQDEYCIDASREEECLQCLERLLGVNLRITEQEMEEAMQNGESLHDIIAELEREADLRSPEAKR